MKTDKELYELYTSDPDELYKILDRKFPQQGVDIRIEQNKQIESTSDLYVIPIDKTEGCHVIENEGRSEKNIHSRGLVSAGLFIDKYPQRQHEVHLIYLTRSLDPYAATTADGKPKKNAEPPPCINFTPTVHYLDERIEQIAKIDPASPLISVFFPLLERDPRKVEREFRQHYDNLKQSPDLPESARPRWLSVFQLWLMRNLELDNLKQIEEMLTEHLPAVEETVWGKELIEKYEEKGLEKGREEGLIEALEAEIEHYEKLKSDGTLSEKAYQSLVESAREKLAELKGNQE